MKRILLILTGFLLLVPAMAQDPGSVLYRGQLQAQYPFRYNGTPYWESPRYRQGTVLYNGRLYEDAWLNVDAFRGEVLAKSAPSRAAVRLSPDQVQWLRLGDAVFVNLGYLGLKGAPEGCVQLIHDGQYPLFKQVVKIFRTDTGDHNGDDIGYVDPAYDPEAPNYFKREVRYHLLKDGTFHLFRKPSDLFRLFPDRKSGMRRYVRAAGLSARDMGADAYLASVLSFIETSQATVEPAVQQWHESGDVPSGSVNARADAKAGDSLPDGYFSHADGEAAEGPSTTALSATYQNKIYVIGAPGSGARRATLSGNVIDFNTGDPLPGVLVFDDSRTEFATTDAQGRYALELPCGETAVNFSESTKEDMRLLLQLLGDGQLDVLLHEKITMLKGSMVSAESMANHRRAGMGMERVSIQTISKIPSAFGEGDVLKGVLTLPGVKTVGEASGGFNVRGGAQDQNLILLNDNTIYNPSHLFGLFSSFNPDVVDEVELYKSSIPARYGGRVSSVLTVNTKEGDREKFKGSAGIGLLTSRLHLEGPIAKGKTTFILGARTTYSDWILKRLPANSGYAGGSAGFLDGNLAVTHRINASEMLEGSLYGASDRFSFFGDTSFNYANLNGSLVYKRFHEDGEAFRLSTGFDYYRGRLQDQGDAYSAYRLDNVIRQGFVKGQDSRRFGDHVLTYGADLLLYAMDPGKMAPVGEASLVAARRLKREFALEGGLHVSDAWNPGGKFSLEGGLRLSSFLSFNGWKPYLNPEVRFSAKYSVLDNLSLKAGFNTLSQYIHLISNTSSISPVDTWKLSDASIRPTVGWQGAGGIYWTELNSGLDVSVEGYYKGMSHYLDYASGAVLVMNDHLADFLVPVEGKAYGVEVLLKRTTGRITGWMSYTYARTLLREMQDRGLYTINGGKWYNAPYDKPHDVKVALNFAFTHRYSLSVNVDYSTGRPVTIPVGQYRYRGGFYLSFSERNSYRIPDYFRVDAALNIDPGHYLKSLLHTTITLGVYNVTGRKNPYSVYFTTNAGTGVTGNMISVFATQVPYINLNILF